MKILITGATGFVGKNLVPVLCQDHQLYLIVRNIDKARNLFADYDKIEYIKVDEINDVKQYDIDVAIHLAAYLTSKNDTDSMSKLIDSNIVFATKLLDVLKESKYLSLFINFGTFAEYRFGPQKQDNAYLYSATKSAFRCLLKYYAELSGYKAITLVPYSIYGGKDSQKKVMDYLKDSFESLSPIKMSGGEQILDFIHMDDVVSCIKFIIDNIQRFMAEPTEEYHLGSGKGTSIRELAAILERKHNRKCNVEWGALEYRERDIMYAVAPIGKLIEMGWHTKISLEDGI